MNHKNSELKIIIYSIMAFVVMFGEGIILPLLGPLVMNPHSELVPVNSSLPYTNKIYGLTLRILEIAMLIFTPLFIISFIDVFN